MNRLPADHCSICDRPLTIGVRLIASHRIGVVLVPQDTRLIELHQPCQVSPIENRELALVVWGDIWTGDAIQRAISVANLGQRPWFCQACGRLDSRAGATWLRPDGSMPHAPSGIPPSDPTD